MTLTQREQFFNRERNKAYRIRRTLPARIRDFYEPQYGLGLGNVEGELVGFCCRVCKTWGYLPYHDKTCPVAKLPGVKKAQEIFKRYEDRRHQQAMERVRDEFNLPMSP